MFKFLRKILSARRTKQEEQIFKIPKAYMTKLKKEHEEAVKTAEEWVEKHKPIGLTEFTKNIASKVAATSWPKKFNFTFRRTYPAPIATKPPPTPPEEGSQSLEAVNKALNTRIDKLEQLIAHLELKLNPPSLFSRLKTVIHEKMTQFFEISVPKRVTSEYEYETPKQIGWMKKMALKAPNIIKPALPPPVTAFTLVPDEKDKSPCTTMLESANHMLIAKCQAIEQTVVSMKKEIAEKRQKRLYKLKGQSPQMDYNQTGIGEIAGISAEVREESTYLTILQSRDTMPPEKSDSSERTGSMSRRTMNDDDARFLASIVGEWRPIQSEKVDEYLGSRGFSAHQKSIFELSHLHFELDGELFTSYYQHDDEIHFMISTQFERTFVRNDVIRTFFVEDDCLYTIATEMTGGSVICRKKKFMKDGKLYVVRKRNGLECTKIYEKVGCEVDPWTVYQERSVGAEERILKKLAEIQKKLDEREEKLIVDVADIKRKVENTDVVGTQIVAKLTSLQQASQQNQQISCRESRTVSRIEQRIEVEPNDSQQSIEEIPPPIIQYVSVTLEELLVGTQKPMPVERKYVVDGITKVQYQTIMVRIDRGMADGTMIRIPSPVGPNESLGFPAEYVFIVKEEPHPKFTRRGADLYRFEKFPEATSSTMLIPTLEGLKYPISFDEIIRAGGTVRVHGFGLPYQKSVFRGLLIIKFLADLEVPEESSVAKKELMLVQEKIVVSTERLMKDFKALVAKVDVVHNSNCRIYSKLQNMDSTIQRIKSVMKDNDLLFMISELFVMSDEWNSLSREFYNEYGGSIRGVFNAMKEEVMALFPKFKIYPKRAAGEEDSDSDPDSDDSNKTLKPDEVEEEVLMTSESPMNTVVDMGLGPRPGTQEAVENPAEPAEASVENSVEPVEASEEEPVKPGEEMEEEPVEQAEKSKKEPTDKPSTSDS